MSLEFLDKFIEARVGQFERNRSLFVAGVAAILLFVICAIYALVSSIIVNANFSNMKELAEHDKQAIKNSVYFRQQEIMNLADSLWRHRVLSIQALHEHLRTTNDQFGMHRISVASDKGVLYSSSGTTKEEKAYTELIRSNPEGFVTRYGNKNGVIVFGAPVHSFRVENERFNYVLGEILVRDLAESMEISSFEGSGISFVVDNKGDFVVSSTGRNENNIFEEFPDADVAGYSKDQFAEAIKARKEITTHMTHDGEDYMLVASPTDYNWTIISIVPISVFRGLSYKITSIVVVLVLIVLGALSLVLMLLLRSRSIKEREAADARYIAEIEEMNSQLQENQSRLEELTTEQEGQIEEINQLNKQLEEAFVAAEAANDAKTSFLFNMSHDIRTPMNAIIGFRDLLEKHQEDPQKRADYLRKIDDASTVLLSIINNVLEMARIEKGTIEIDESAWSAEQFNDTLYSVFQELMVQKGIEFTREVKVEHNYVLCDPIKLREVFLNILSNAYKYTNSGGKVHMCLEEVPSDDPTIALYKTTITDTGIGMSEDFLPHIFEEFSREANSTETKIEGTGLGMPIVKRLLDLMGGTVKVTSAKGVGTSFEVTIPHRITDKSSLVEHFGVEIDPKLFTGKRILLAEDNELNAEIAIEILSEAGFVVERAEDGFICVEMLKLAAADYYDIILMDIQMPHMNGYEATREIRKLSDSTKSKIKILAMTANAFEEDKREAFRAGMNGHLAKPVNVHELMKTLARMLG